MGNDLHGMDYTKAAKRAIEDAFRHSSLPLFGALDLSHEAMRVQVTVGGAGAREPWILAALAKPNVATRGAAEVTRGVSGGLNVVPDEGDGDTIVIAPGRGRGVLAGAGRGGG